MKVKILHTHQLRQIKCSHPDSDKFDSKEDILANEKEKLSKGLQEEV
jgi:hypothetical protein